MIRTHTNALALGTLGLAALASTAFAAPAPPIAPPSKAIAMPLPSPSVLARGPQNLSLPLPKGTPQRPAGMPALQVRQALEPAFGLDDVKAYFLKHNLPANLSKLGEFRATKLEFMNALDAEKRLDGIATGLAPQDHVALATLEGRFVFAAPNGKRAEFAACDVLFDAITGSLLIVSPR